MCNNMLFKAIVHIIIMTNLCQYAQHHVEHELDCVPHLLVTVNENVHSRMCMSTLSIHNHRSLSNLDLC